MFCEYGPNCAVHLVGVVAYSHFIDCHFIYIYNGILKGD